MSEGRTTPGGYVAAAAVPQTTLQTLVWFVSRHDRMILGLADLQGRILVSRTCATLDLDDDGDFHGLLRSARYRFFMD